MQWQEAEAREKGQTEVNTEEATKLMETLIDECDNRILELQNEMRDLLVRTGWYMVKRACTDKEREFESAMDKFDSIREEINQYKAKKEALIVARTAIQYPEITKANLRNIL